MYCFYVASVKSVGTDKQA